MNLRHKIATRENQSKKIVSILKDFLNKENLKHYSCLEVGCGTGEISAFFADKVKVMWGIEIDRTIILQHQTSLYKNLSYMEADGAQLPFSGSTFDIVLFPQVYEHTKEQQKVFNEIYRVLKPDGICFFSGPNRFQIVEPHYFLPFLSWLPNRLSTIYLRIAKKGNIFDVYPRSFWTLLKFTKNFIRYDYTSKLIKFPEIFSVDSRAISPMVKKFPPWLIKLLEPFYPNYNWVLVKRNYL